MGGNQNLYFNIILFIQKYFEIRNKDVLLTFEKYFSVQIKEK